MYRRILLPLDLSDQNAPALEAAARLADPRIGCVVLIHVIERVAGLEDAEMEDFYAELRSRAANWLNKCAKQLEDKGLSTSQEIAIGKRALEIVRHADSEACDLVVLTSHAASEGRPGWGIGTVSHQVALTAPCSVLLVR